MRTSDFDYRLPPELIAQTPAEPRDSSRLMALDRATGRTEHRRFTDVLDYLRPGDLMVFQPEPGYPGPPAGGARRQRRQGGVAAAAPGRRGACGKLLARPGRRLRPGATVTIVPPEGKAPGYSSDRRSPGVAVQGLEGGAAFAGGFYRGDGAYAAAALYPPGGRRTRSVTRRSYASEPGSAAAPTAGLHFTPGLLSRIRAAGGGDGVCYAARGTGTPSARCMTRDPAAHTIHTERYSLDAAAADALNRARRSSGPGRGRRVIAVGTTGVRVLEQAAADADREGRGFAPVEGDAGIYILPGHRFRAVDAMLTNFHLPRSTLLMLVSAFAQHGAGGPPDSGRRMMLAAYAEAIRMRYRFYSFGDAMLIV